MSEKHLITTALGMIDPDQLGPTLMHEHPYCDISIQSGKPDNVLTDVALIVRELSRYREAGGRSIVEMTPVGLGRNSERLAQIAKASDVHIISGIAFYTEDTYPTWLRSATRVRIGDFLVEEIEAGQNGVRAGLIGELASHNESHADSTAYRLTDIERQVFNAAADAQRRTGVTIATHAALGRGGHAQLDALESAGAELSRVVTGHCDAQITEDPDEDMAYYLGILRRGACCSFDLIGWTELVEDHERAVRLVELLRQGFASQIVLGSDTCRRSQLGVLGGRGIDHVLRSFIPRIRGLGATDGQITSMLCDAPRRLLARTNASSDQVSR